MNRNLLATLSLLADLSSHEDLSIPMRLAVGMSREILLDLRAVPPPLYAVGPLSEELVVERLFQCLSRSIHGRGTAASRSRLVAELIGSGPPVSVVQSDLRRSGLRD